MTITITTAIITIITTIIILPGVEEEDVPKKKNIQIIYKIYEIIKRRQIQMFKE